MFGWTQMFEELKLEYEQQAKEKKIDAQFPPAAEASR